MSAFLLVACSSGVTVTADHDLNTNFSKYKTFRWREANKFNVASKNYLTNDIIDGRIKAAVEKTLSSKGFEGVDEGNVDFYINYSITTQEKVDIHTYNTYDGFAPGFYRYRGVGYGGSETRVNYYQEGTLVLDVLDAN